MSKNKTTQTTTFIEQIKKSRSLKSITDIIKSGKFTCSNPKTLRRWNRAIAEKFEKLKIAQKPMRLKFTN